MNKNQKLPYEPPLLEVYEYVVEHGFAQTNPVDATQLETFSEITDNPNNPYETGENYHGEWY